MTRTVLRALLFLLAALAAMVGALSLGTPLIERARQAWIHDLLRRYDRVLAPAWAALAAADDGAVAEVGVDLGLRVERRATLPPEAALLQEGLVAWSPVGDLQHLACLARPHGDGWLCMALPGPDAAYAAEAWRHLRVVRRQLAEERVPPDPSAAGARSEALSAAIGLPIHLQPQPPQAPSMPLDDGHGAAGLQTLEPDGSKPLWIPTGDGWARIDDPDTGINQGGLLVLGLIVIALLGVAVGSALLWRRRLRRLALTIAAIARGDHDARCHERSRDLFGQLGRDIDSMAEQLSCAAAQARSLLFTLAHELRTPLARARMRLAVHEAAHGTAIAEVDQDLAELADVIAEVSDQLRRDGAAPLRRAPCDLGEIARLATRRSRLTVELQVSPAPIHALPQAMQRVIVQICANAERHGASALVVQSGVSDGRAWLTITDDGPGIDPEQTALLGQPQPSRHPEGSGLGLALCAQTVQAAGGRFTATASGSGTCWRVDFPARGAEDVAG